MTQLTAEHIDFICKDLHYRGIVLDGFYEEVLDHLCTVVEEEMARGQRFIDAYHIALQRFGHTHGLRQTQQEVLRFENKTTKLMFRNYLMISLRNLAKHRFYSLINVIGLAIGIAACIVIALFIRYETSFDKHFAAADRLYRVNTEIRFGDNYYNLAVTTAPLQDALVHEFPEVEAVGRLREQGVYSVRRDKETFRQNNITWADSSVFDVFGLTLLAGNADKVLTEPNTIVISKRVAEKYFPNEDPIGQTLTFFDNWNNKVVGVINNMPDNSHFHFDIFISMMGNDESKNTNWLGNNFHTYVRLREGVRPADFEQKLKSLYSKYVGPQASEVFGGDFSEEAFAKAGNVFRYYLTPVTDIHLRSALAAELEPNSDITYIYLFGAVALFILVIACINFMNLSTARSANRAKEVGIRKVMGSLRSHLIRQFLLESSMLSVLAFVVAVGLAHLMLPLFNLLAQRSLTLPFGEVNFYVALLGGALLLGVLAGVYPSFFLSSFKPVNVLKGKVALGMKSGAIRSSLVVFQFMISIFLIVATVAVQQQLDFIQHKKLGFDKDQVLVVKNAYSLGKDLDAFKNTLLGETAIKDASVSGFLPVYGTERSSTSYWAAGQPMSDHNSVGLQTFYVDHDYVKTFGMKIVEGRNFSRDFLSDSSGVVLNQAAAQAFGFGSDAVGKKIESFFIQPDNSIDKNMTVSFTVIGVVEDFHFDSMRDNIKPLVFHLGNSTGCISFRFTSADAQAVVNLVEQTWKKLAPGQPFEYMFLSDSFGHMYDSERRLGTIFATFAGLAIVIACLGLFALTAFTAEQRNKEIGIRKVLGASVSSIVLLLSKEFGKLIVIAFVLAVPLSWYAVRWWLEHYTYKTNPGVTIYFIAGAAAFLVAWVTMGYQSIKAASSNPVDVLRSE